MLRPTLPMVPAGGLANARWRKPILAGSVVPDDLYRGYHVGPLGVAGRIQSGRGSAEIQGQTALPGPQAVELPTLQQCPSYAAGCHPSSFTEGEIENRAIGQYVPAVIPGEALVVLIAKLVVSAVVDGLTESVRRRHHETVSEAAIQLHMQGVIESRLEPRISRRCRPAEEDVQRLAGSACSGGRRGIDVDARVGGIRIGDLDRMVSHIDQIQRKVSRQCSLHGQVPVFDIRHGIVARVIIE